MLEDRFSWNERTGIKIINLRREIGVIWRQNRLLEEMLEPVAEKWIIWDCLHWPFPGCRHSDCTVWSDGGNWELWSYQDHSGGVWQTCTWPQLRTGDFLARGLRYGITANMVLSVTVGPVSPALPENQRVSLICSRNFFGQVLHFLRADLSPVSVDW